MLCPTDLGLFQLNFLEIYEFFSIFSDQIWKHLIKLPALKQQAPIWNFKTLLLMKSYEKTQIRRDACQELYFWSNNGKNKIK